MYSDALGRLADRLCYLNSNGEMTADATRYWFDTPTNLRCEMEDRKGRFDADTAVRKKIEDLVKKGCSARTSSTARTRQRTPLT